MAVSAKNYRFVSPGIVTQEIDRSRIPNAPAPIGPVIIGRAERGPAFTPVTVTSFAEFVNTFGNPVPGGLGGDVWRDGNKTSPMYGTYAAQAWLKNGQALTYVRLLGDQSDTATTDGKAGWSFDAPTSTNYKGAYGLFVVPSGAAPVTGTLAAVWYSNGTTVPVLQGSTPGEAATINGNTCAFVSTTDGTFTAYLSGSATSLGPYKFSLDKTKPNYIRKVFNTDPTLISKATSFGNQTYFLGETFEDVLTNNTNPAGWSSTTNYYGVILPLAAGSNNFANRKVPYQPAKSGWIISQDTSQNTGSFTVTGSNGTVSSTFFDSGRVKKLFRFVGLNSGEWIQNNLKIAITNINPPANINVDPYATFDVELRTINDQDTNKKVVESFSGCSLNANSDTFVAKVIGDRYVDYDEITQRLIEYGENPNRSRYIRVEMNPEFQNGTSDYVPFGTTFPVVYKSANITAASVGSAGVITNNVYFTGSSLAAVSASSFATTGAISSQLDFPIPLYRTTTEGLSSNKLAYFGAQPVSDSGVVYSSVIDALKLNAVAGTSYDPAANGDTIYSAIITLDNVRYSGSSPNVNTVLVYDNGARSAGVSLTATGTLPTNFPQSASVAQTYKAPLVLGANKFCSYFYNGSDGFNITESDPLRNGLIGSTATAQNNYGMFSYQRAIDTVKSPEIAQYNAISIPGLINNSLQNRLITNTEQRADALVVVDVPYGYNPPSEYQAASAVAGGSDVPSIGNPYLGNVNDAVTEWSSRAYNSNYACAYYPWVQIRDNVNGTNVWVPPSVVALGAMAYTDAVQAPWFAPAGFNRGGLSSGIAGLPVVNTALKLFQTDRDNLYNININPIASFPNEGIVIFGQKTLQVERSALDRINVRRLLIYIKTGISRIASTVLFDQNIQDTWNRFTGQAEPFLADVKARFGLVDYKFVLDQTTTTPDLIDQNMLYAKVYVKPARAIEFIALDFIITNTGASFED
jgi:hypothetical protein